MSIARTQFLARLSSLNLSLAENAVNDGAPTDIKKNGVASVLRNGLAVLTYATAEAFVRDRVGEVLKSFNPAVVTFSNLPDKLKLAVTIGALKGLLTHSRYVDKTTRVTWALQRLAVVTPVNVASFSEYSFAHESPNVSTQDVGDILSAFGASSGWQCLTNISKRLGMGGVPDYCVEFENIAKRRHSAAHDVTTSIPHGDLTSSLDSVLGFGISFDLILSEICSRYNTGIPLPANVLVDTLMSLRFVSRHPTKQGVFREQVESQKIPQLLHSNKLHPNLNTAWVSALTRATAKKQHLIEWSTTGKPLNWTPW